MCRGNFLMALLALCLAVPAAASPSLESRLNEALRKTGVAHPHLTLLAPSGVPLAAVIDAPPQMISTIRDAVGFAHFMRLGLRGSDGGLVIVDLKPLNRETKRLQAELDGLLGRGASLACVYVDWRPVGEPDPQITSIGLEAQQATPTPRPQRMEIARIAVGRWVKKCNRARAERVVRKMHLDAPRGDVWQIVTAD